MNEIVYELIENLDGTFSVKKTTPDGTIWLVPNDPANSDYQAYLASLEEGQE